MSDAGVQVTNVVLLHVSLAMPSIVRFGFIFSKIILNEAELDSKNYADRGGCFLPWPSTSFKIVYCSRESSKCGKHHLVIKNYPWDWSQSETAKYFE